MNAETPDFRALGSCAQSDPEAFYPEPNQPMGTAKRVCQACPVQSECLDHALTHDERFGIWGGTTPTERAGLRRHLGLPTRAERDRADKRDTARRMRDRGCSKADIGKALGLSGSTVNDYLTDPTTR